MSHALALARPLRFSEKVRVTAACALAVALFTSVGWTAIRPADPQAATTLLLGGRDWPVAVLSVLALAAVASAAGYRWARTTDSLDDLEPLARDALAQDGPAFLLIKVDPGGLPEGTARVDLSPAEMTARMKRALESA